MHRDLILAGDCLLNNASIDANLRRKVIADLTRLYLKLMEIYPLFDEPSPVLQNRLLQPIENILNNLDKNEQAQVVDHVLRYAHEGPRIFRPRFGNFGDHWRELYSYNLNPNIAFRKACLAISRLRLADPRIPETLALELKNKNIKTLKEGARAVGKINLDPDVALKFADELLTALDLPRTAPLYPSPWGEVILALGLLAQRHFAVTQRLIDVVGEYRDYIPNTDTQYITKQEYALAFERQVRSRRGLQWHEPLRR